MQGGSLRRPAPADICLDHGGVRAHLFGGAFRDLAATVHHHDAAGQPVHEAQVVVDQQDADPALLAGGFKPRGQILGFRGVHPRRRLVQQQDRGFLRQGARDLKPLARTIRQTVRPQIRDIAQVEGRQVAQGDGMGLAAPVPDRQRPPAARFHRRSAR